jgi:hypothetical protein
MTRPDDIEVVSSATMDRKRRIEAVGRLSLRDDSEALAALSASLAIRRQRS